VFVLPVDRDTTHYFFILKCVLSVDVAHLAFGQTVRRDKNTVGLLLHVRVGPGPDNDDANNKKFKAAQTTARLHHRSEPRLE
jgi:hypothetical protein